MPDSPIVLICAEEPLLAALLGMLAEEAGYAPVFPRAGERPEDALARLRPLLVILLEAALDSARSDLFFSHAAKRKVGVALFTRQDAAAMVEAVAESRGVQWFTAPLTVADLERVLDTAATSPWWDRRPDRRTPQPRRQRSTEQTSDGALVFRDREGQRWLVYDRRGPDRRLAARRGEAGAMSAEPDQRLFVNEQGERWELMLGDGEIDERSAGALEEQLARATRV